MHGDTTGDNNRVTTTDNTTTRLIDRFGRHVTYARLSVTDRCDFRCVYCMSEDMTFLPRAQVLTLEEIHTVARAFTELGVTKLRLTGGEPLVRRNILWLVREIGKLPGLAELVLTTNGSQLDRLAGPLSDAGVKRINVSLDSLDEARFRNITRVGDLNKVLRGIEAARAAGFEAANRIGFIQVADLVATFLEFGGQVLLGGVIITVGFWMANIAHGALQGLSKSGVAPFAGIVRYGIIGLVLAMGLRAMGIAIEELRLVGGAANNRLWCEILADVCDVPVRRLLELESAALGAALQAMWAVARQDDPEVEIKTIVEPFARVADDVIEPGPAVSEYRVMRDEYAVALDRYYGVV